MVVARGSRAQIMVVEDEPLAALDLRVRLERLGHSVVGVAPTGEAAMEQLRRDQPSLVLVDAGAAGRVDGLETAQTIRETFGTPVVLLASYTDQETLRRAMSADPFGCLVKPVEDRELGSAIELALYRASAERAMKEQQALLEQRVREIAALNRTLQSNIQQRFEMARAYQELVEGINRLGDEARGLTQVAASQELPNLIDALSSDLED